MEHMNALPAGTRLAEYEVVEVLGAGAAAGGQCEWGRRAGVCDVAIGSNRQDISVTERSGMGGRGAGRDDNPVLVGGRDRAEPGEL